MSASPALLEFALLDFRLVKCATAYSLLSRLRDVLVRFEKRADVDRLAAPEVSVNGPVEGELQRAAVEVSGEILSSCWQGQWLAGALTRLQSSRPWWKV